MWVATQFRHISHTHVSHAIFFHNLIRFSHRSAVPIIADCHRHRETARTRHEFDRNDFVNESGELSSLSGMTFTSSADNVRIIRVISEIAMLLRHTVNTPWSSKTSRDNRLMFSKPYDFDLSSFGGFVRSMRKMRPESRSKRRRIMRLSSRETSCCGHDWVEKVFCFICNANHDSWWFFSISLDAEIQFMPQTEQQNNVQKFTFFRKYPNSFAARRQSRKLFRSRSNKKIYTFFLHDLGECDKNEMFAPPKEYHK